jgi:hypothetical protein
MRVLALALGMFWVSIPGIICLVPMAKTTEPGSQCHMHQGDDGKAEIKPFRCCAEVVRIGAALTSRFDRDDVPESELTMPYVPEIGCPIELSILSVSRDIHSPPNDPGTSSLILRI